MVQSTICNYSMTGVSSLIINKTYMDNWYQESPIAMDLLGVDPFYLRPLKSGDDKRKLLYTSTSIRKR